MSFENLRHFPRLGFSSAMSLFGLTARALRFYEEKGLLTARRDRLNARYYDPVARARLAWIARLRRADLALLDIEEVLHAVDGGQGTQCALLKLRRRREAAAQELAAVDAVIAELESSDAEATPYRIGTERNR